MKESEGIEITVRKIQGFRECGRSGRDAGRGNPGMGCGDGPTKGEGRVTY
jgi:hypothetical protein